MIGLLPEVAIGARYHAPGGAPRLYTEAQFKRDLRAGFLVQPSGEESVGPKQVRSVRFVPAGVLPKSASVWANKQISWADAVGSKPVQPADAIRAKSALVPPTAAPPPATPTAPPPDSWQAVRDALLKQRATGTGLGGSVVGARFKNQVGIDLMDFVNLLDCIAESGDITTQTLPSGFPVHVVPRIAEILAASAREGVRVLYDTCAASNMASSDFPIKLYAESNVYFTGATSSASVRGGGVGCCTIRGAAASLAVTDIHVVNTLPSNTLLLSGNWVRNALGPLQHRHLSFHDSAITFRVPQDGEVHRASFALDYVNGLLQFLDVTVTPGVDASVMPLPAAGYAVEGASAEGATASSTTSASFMVHVASVSERAAAEPNDEDAAAELSMHAAVNAAAVPLPPNSPITPLSRDSDELPSTSVIPVRPPIEDAADELRVEAHPFNPYAVAAPIEDDDMDLLAEIIAIDEACAARDDLRQVYDTCAGNSMAAAKVPAPAGADIVQPATPGAAPAAAAGTSRTLRAACRYRALVDGSAQELSDDDGDSDDSQGDPAAAGAPNVAGADRYALLRRKCIR